MKDKVLVSAPYFFPVLERFRSEIESHGIEIVVADVHEILEAEDLLPLVGDIDGALCGNDRYTAEVLEAAPRLRVISKWGTGIDSIDQEACAERGVLLFNTPNAFTEPVADSVLGYVLCFARKLPWMSQTIKSGTWKKTTCTALNEAVLGVIGVGNIGKAIIKRARAFGMEVIGNDIQQIDQAFLDQYQVTMVELDQLLQQADFVSLNCDLNPSSFHLMGEREFSVMNSSAVLINTSRGPVVDQAAVTKALQDGQIAGAALDVVETEPLPHDSPLCRMDNVLLAPHNSNSSTKAWERVHRTTVDGLIKGLEQTR